jgi:AraC-like DNA-binding protein
MTAIEEQLLLESPGARPCRCKRVRHEHGQLSRYTADRCRCQICRDAFAAYYRHRNRQAAYGRWAAFADGQAARDHVHALMRAGLHLDTIADLASLSQTTLRRLMYGIGGDPPGPRIRKSTAEALLAVTAYQLPRGDEQPNLLTLTEHPDDDVPQAVPAHGGRRNDVESQT